MLPDYIIYDELKKRRKKRNQRDERPRLEIPRHRPYVSEEEEDDEERDDQPDRGVEIIEV